MLLASIESDSQKDARPAEEAGTKRHQMRGRKPAYESRAAEFRRELIIWKQTSESLRPSLRALAGKLGTTHQMLAYYLNNNRLGRWQAKENAKRIRARAEAEGREMTMRECLDVIITPGWLDQIEKLREAARRGPLNRHQVQMLKQFAKPGLPGAQGAQEILARCRQMTAEEEKQARAFERKALFSSAALKTIECIRRDGERGPLCWQDVERLKYFARHKHQGAKELLQKYSKSALPRPQGVTQ